MRTTLERQERMRAYYRNNKHKWNAYIDKYMKTLKADRTVWQDFIDGKKQYKSEHYKKNKHRWKEYSRKHRESNPEACKQRRIDTRKKHYEIVVELKSKPCTDCGNCFPPECMDFDHVRGEKKIKLNGVHGKERFYAEIAKCELVCANCHRTRTKKRNIERKAEL